MFLHFSLIIFVVLDRSTEPDMSLESPCHKMIYNAPSSQYVSL